MSTQHATALASIYVTAGWGKITKYILFNFFVFTDPSKAPQNVSAESFLLPTEVDVKWLALPLIYWNGIPLGYRATLTAHSVGGMELRSDAVFSITNTVPPAVTSCKFTNLKPFYKYSIEVSAFNKVGDGPKSAAKYVGK